MGRSACGMRMLRLCGCLWSSVSDVGHWEEAIGKFSVLCKFKNVAEQFECAFIGVYGPNCVRDRRLLWEKLSGLCSWWNVPRCGVVSL